MVTAKYQTELLEVVNDMYQLLVYSSQGSWRRGCLLKMVGYSSGLVHRYRCWCGFIVLLSAFSRFQWMQIFGEEFQCGNRPMSSFMAAAVDDWSVRPDPLSDSVDGVSEMIISSVAEVIAVGR
jgi:hypothetical protein